MDPISSNSQCDKHALTDFYGWMLQVLLAGIAFTCLIVKRFFEPKYVRRSWETWWYDTSKQGIGAFVIHMINVYLAALFQGDPCTWYIINFLLDSTIGLFIIYIGIRVSQYLAVKQQWGAIMFGEYTVARSWLYQTCIYVALMVLVKLITTLFMQMEFWNNVKDMVLSPFSSPRIELVMVMLVIPLFVNMLMFWVTDNFLMRHKRKTRPIVGSFSSDNGDDETTLFERVRVRYRALHTNTKIPLLLDDSETDHQLTDEEAEDSDRSRLICHGGQSVADTSIAMIASMPGNDTRKLPNESIVQNKTVQRNSVSSIS